MRPLLLAGLALAMAGCAAPVDEDPERTRVPPPDPLALSPEALPPLPIPAEADLTPFERALGKRMRAVAEITVEVEQQAGDDVVGHGSGVLVSADGLVLTAGHVVRDPHWTLRVVLPGGESRRAEVVARDVAHDAALLRTSGGPTPFVTLPSRPRPAGTWAVCTGHAADGPTDRVPVRSAGVIVERPYAWTTWEVKKAGSWRSELVKGATLYGMIRLDCATAPGMSGGPVVDVDGELLGLVVGSGGIVSPIEAIRHLLPAGSGAIAAAPKEPHHAGRSSPEPVLDAAGRPSRAATFTPLFDFAAAERSVVDLAMSGTIGFPDRHFPGVLVSSDGLAIAPAVWLAGFPETGVTLPPTAISVVGHPGAHVTEIVAVRDELALLRLSGLLPATTDDEEAALRPAGPPGAVAVGEVVASLGAGAGQRSIGFVTAEGRRPGRVAPPGPRAMGGCGQRHMHFRQAFPFVNVAGALAHDAELPAYGSLIIDRQGRPLAIEVASNAPGVDFAVPWSEVTARFGEWLAPAR